MSINSNKNIIRCDRQQLEIICVDKHLKQSRTCGTGENEANPITLGPLEHISAPNLCREFPFLYFGEKTSLSVDRKPYSKCVKLFCLVSLGLPLIIPFLFFLPSNLKARNIDKHLSTNIYTSCIRYLQLINQAMICRCRCSATGLFITHIINITSMTGCLIYVALYPKSTDTTFYYLYQTCRCWHLFCYQPEICFDFK